MGVWQLTSSWRSRVLALWWPRPPGGKRSSLQRIDAPGSGVWQFGLGHPRCSSSGRIRKRAKARNLIRDRQLQIWNWEYVWLAFLSCLLRQAKHVLDRFCFALRLIVFIYSNPILIYISLNRLPIWNLQNRIMFPLAFVVGWLQGHWWGFISRNYVVWSTVYLMNVFIALKGSHFWLVLVQFRYAQSIDAQVRLGTRQISFLIFIIHAPNRRAGYQLVASKTIHRTVMM